MMKKLRNIHPGEVFNEEFLKPIRLARHFGTSEQFWMALQADYDLEEARKALRRAA